MSTEPHRRGHPRTFAALYAHIVAGQADETVARTTFAP